MEEHCDGLARGRIRPGRDVVVAAGSAGLRRVWRWWLGFGLVMAVLGVGTPGPEARATRLVMLTIEELARDADAVVHGRVMAVEASRGADGRVRTVVTLKVADVWKGKGISGTCLVEAGGGILGEVEVRALGQVEYAVGDEVVAYLVRSPSGMWVTLGMAQGQFRVSRDESSGNRWVRNPFWGGNAGGVDGGGGPRLAAWPPARPLSLEELKRRTREAKP